LVALAGLAGPGKKAVREVPAEWEAMDKAGRVQMAATAGLAGTVVTPVMEVLAVPWARSTLSTR
jgi:hypothetical protein